MAMEPQLALEISPMCLPCGETLCYYHQLRKDVLDKTELCHTAKVGNDRPPSNAMHKTPYSFYIYERNGFLGKGRGVHIAYFWVLLWFDQMACEQIWVSNRNNGGGKEEHCSSLA